MSPKKFFDSKIVVAFAFAAMLAIPSFAQTTQQKAKEIQAAGQAAKDSNNAEQSRSINDSAWDGAEGNKNTDISDGKIILIGGNAPDDKKDDKSSFDTQKTDESEDVTPWSGIITGIKWTLGIIVGALALAAIFFDADSFASTVFATIFCGIAAAASAALIGLGATLMIKYGQSAMGGIWLAAGAAFLALSIYSMVKGIKAGSKIRQGTDEAKKAAEASLKNLGKVLGVAGTAGGVLDGNTDNINEKAEKK